MNVQIASKVQKQDLIEMFSRWLYESSEYDFPDKKELFGNFTDK